MRFWITSSQAFHEVYTSVRAPELESRCTHLAYSEVENRTALAVHPRGAYSSPSRSRPRRTQPLTRWPCTDALTTA